MPDRHREHRKRSVPRLIENEAHAPALGHGPINSVAYFFSPTSTRTLSMSVLAFFSASSVDIFLK